MLSHKLFDKLTTGSHVLSAWDFKVALSVAVLTSEVSAIMVFYNIGYLHCRGSFEYLSSLGIMSRHGNYLDNFTDYLKFLPLQITFGLIICAIGLWSRRAIGFFLSSLALMWIGALYLRWHLNTLEIMRNNEIEDFSILQGPDRQHLVILNGATWWDLVVLAVVITLFVWQLKTLIVICRSSRVQHNVKYMRMGG